MGRRPRHVQRNQGKGNKEWKDRTIQHDRNVRTSNNNRTRTSRELGNAHSSARKQRMELRNEVYSRILIRRETTKQVQGTRNSKRRKRNLCMQMQVYTGREPLHANASSHRRAKSRKT